MVCERIEIDRARHVGPWEPRGGLKVDSYQCLALDGITPRQLEAVIFYERGLRKFVERHRANEESALPWCPRRPDDATRLIRRFVVTTKVECAHDGAQRVAAAVDVAE